MLGQDSPPVPQRPAEVLLIHGFTAKTFTLAAYSFTS